MNPPTTDTPDIDEAALRRFERAWRSGRPEPLDSFLPDPADPRFLPTLEELVAVELEFAWKAFGRRATRTLGGQTTPTGGRVPLVEDYAARFPPLREPVVLGRLVRQELFVRCQYDDRPAAAEYRHRFPDLPAVPFPDDTPNTPTPDARASADGGAGGYELGEEIGRGGMGLVHRARQNGLDRAVAVKTLRPELAGDPAAAARFLTEARITGRLQHPGVPPVHQTGVLPDGRPFLAMKLIRGQTLERALNDRPDPAADRARFVAVYEKVCQAVAYAHANGVIHRDLKPANVMVGDYGEVQVMDWGLARRVRSAESGGRNEDTPTATTGVPTDPHSELSTPHSALTHTGAVLGTPSFLPPEQARGEHGAVNERSDVFGLGAILCVILTGQPPFTGMDGEVVRRLAAGGRLEEAFARLNGCGADPELVALCTRCLAPDPADRPADGGAVAEAVGAFRAGLEERARRAEAERAVAEAEAREQRKRRRVQLALTVAVLSIAGLVAVGVWRNEERKRERAADELVQAAKADSARARARSLLDLAAQLRGEYRHRAAADTLRQAKELAEQFAPDLAATVAQATADLEFVVELDRVRMSRATWLPFGGDSRRPIDDVSGPTRYRRAFATRGMDVVADPDLVARSVAASAIRNDLVSALDDWAVLEPDAAVRDRLLACARLADPASGMNPFRDAALWADRERLKAVTAAADPARMSPAAVVALAELMRFRGLDAAPLLRHAVALYPRDFLVALWLGNVLFDRPPAAGGADHVGMVSAYRAARALRPDAPMLVNNLGMALAITGDRAGAIAVLRSADPNDPLSGAAFGSLAFVLAREDRTGAVNALRQSVRLNRERPVPESELDAEAHLLLGSYLSHFQAADEAIALYSEFLATDDTHPGVRAALGNALYAKGDYRGAIRCFEKAFTRDKDNARTLTSLGGARQASGDQKGAIADFRKALALDGKLAETHFGLGLALRATGDLDGAVAAFRTALDLDRRHAKARACLAVALADKKDFPAAFRVFLEANAFAEPTAAGYLDFGNALHDAGDPHGAAVLFRKALALDPKYVPALVNLGNHLRRAGDPDAAIDLYRKALGIDPTCGDAHNGLGNVRIDKGDLAGAVAAFEDAVKAAPRVGLYRMRLGLTCYQLKKYPEAVAHARAAIALGDKDGFAHGVLGLALLEVGDIPGARAAIETAIQIDPKMHTELRAKLPPLEAAPPPRPVGR